MADIKTFSSIRPATQYAAAIAALPYDVYSRTEAKKIAVSNPLSFLNIDRPETQFADDMDMYHPDVYQKAHDTLIRMMVDGYFIKEETDCYYIYELTMNGRTQTGLVGCASIDDYLDGTIQKHENTRADKESDRICHLDACDAQTGPIFLAYRTHKTINRIVAIEKDNEPLYHFVSEDHVTHTVWRITSPAHLTDMKEAFCSIPNIYIADGHHRAASAVKVGLKRREEAGSYNGTEEFNYFLSVLFPDNQLHIMDYNRVVLDLNGYTNDDFLSLLSVSFEISAPLKYAYRPDSKGTFGMYLGGYWYQLTAKSCVLSSDCVDALDVSILQNVILSPILGIEDPKISERIHFVGGIRGLNALKEEVDARADGVAFSMYPTSMQELFAVADAGRLMPPKSTWFEPKLRSGLFIHSLSTNKTAMD